MIAVKQVTTPDDNDGNDEFYHQWSVIRWKWWWRWWISPAPFSSCWWSSKRNAERRPANGLVKISSSTGIVGIIIIIIIILNIVIIKISPGKCTLDKEAPLTVNYTTVHFDNIWSQSTAWRELWSSVLCNSLQCLFTAVLPVKLWSCARNGDWKLFTPLRLHLPPLVSQLFFPLISLHNFPPHISTKIFPPHISVLFSPIISPFSTIFPFHISFHCIFSFICITSSPSYFNSIFSIYKKI